MSNEHSTNTLHVRKRITYLVFLVLIIIIGSFFFSMTVIFFLFSSANNSLIQSQTGSREFVSATLTQEVTQLMLNGQSLARDTSVIRFINGTSLGVNQAAARAVDVIALNNGYIHIRHLDASGHIRFDIANINGIANPVVYIEESAPLSPFAESPSFLQAITSDDVIPVVSEYRLQELDSGNSSVVLDIFIPIMANAQSSPIGVTHVEFEVGNLIRSSLIRTRGFRSRILLFDRQAQIVGDSNRLDVVAIYTAGIVEDSVLASDRQIYENAAHFLSNIQDDVAFKFQGRYIYTVRSVSVDDENFFRIVIGDDIFDYYSRTIITTIGILLLNLCIVFGSIWFLRSRLKPIVEEVEFTLNIVKRLGL